MTASTTTKPLRHETRALLRAHLAAASGHPHRTGHCPICHRLQRLAMESVPGDDLFAGAPGTGELFAYVAVEALGVEPAGLPDGQSPPAA
ncbi:MULTISPECIES: DUF6274 family protein [unclassified Streptomyces]|uniref:DUF6274 family protein n=1 Tax=unclassified Streptomyces TaxID=2593676 RepID=UPI002E2E835C|nr:DUF6274 family protein [Streptomyces sp. NBC_01429]